VKTASLRFSQALLALIGVFSGAVSVPIGSQTAWAQSDDSGDAAAIELVDPKVFRVCDDPHNLPFSNEAGDGFENKIATLLAEKLQKPVAYTFYPNTTGFVRNTLNAFRCDVVMGIPQGDAIVQGTNPYYRTAYALVSKQGSGLDKIETLEDPLLKGKHIGIIAGTPPSTNLAVNGLIANAKPYPLVVDSRYDAPTLDMIEDLKKGTIDIAVLWGPIAGYLAKKSETPLVVVPLVKEATGPKMVYRIGMGVRHSDQNWKRDLNKLIAENQGEIDKILTDYGVPLLDENNQPLKR
jgi:quinoprotein dehydrogenase-associated probable ABC transporter substrate-binding protein